MGSPSAPSAPSASDPLGGPAPPRLLAALVPDLLSLLLPTSCAGCGLVDVPLCPACARALAVPDAPAAPVVLRAPGSPPTWGSLAYAGPVRACVVAWKDRGRADLTRVLARPLAAAASCAVGERSGGSGGSSGSGGSGGSGGSRAAVPVLLVPVPSAPRAVRRRGADVLAVLAERTARELRAAGAPVRVERALRGARRVADQAGLSAPERAENLRGALAVVPGALVAGRRVVVVDDVATTGSTLAEAARALRAAGAADVRAAVVALTARRPGLAAPAPDH